MYICMYIYINICLHRAILHVYIYIHIQRKTSNNIHVSFPVWRTGFVGNGLGGSLPFAGGGHSRYQESNVYPLAEHRHPEIC